MFGDYAEGWIMQIGWVEGFVDRLIAGLWST